MTQAVVFTGTVAGDGTGNRGQVPWNAFNANCTELYSNAFFLGTDSGAVNASIVIYASLKPNPAASPALTTGTVLRFTPIIANTGPATLNFAGNTTAIVTNAGAPLTGGELQTVPMIFEYNGTAWQILSTNTSALITELLTQSGIGAKFYPVLGIEAATVVNGGYYYGDPRRYGALGNGATDDSTAFANAALVSGTLPMLVYKTASFYKIGTPFQLPAGGTMYGYGYPLLKPVSAGQIICYAVSSISTITIQGISFQGIDSSTPPLTVAAINGIYSPNNNGLATITNCADVRITDCNFSTFPNGVAAQGCTRLWIMRNYVTHWGGQITGVGSGVSNAGILSGSAVEFVIDDNTVDGCDMPGGATFFPSYCISFTGSSTQKGNSVSNNRCWNNPGWDGLGSHDIFGCTISNNDIRNVRKGIDIGQLLATNLVRSLVCASNYIEATTTDLWQGQSIEEGGIVFEGFSSTGPVGIARITNPGSLYVNGTYTAVPLTGGSGTLAAATIVVSGGKCVSLTITNGGNNYAITDSLSASNANLGGAGSGLAIAVTPSTLCDGCSITGNIIRGFFNIANGVAGGIPSSITLFQAAHCSVTGNTICDVGSLQANGSGVFLQGTLAQISISGNSFHGDMGSGGIRLSSATIDMLAVTGNSCNQTNPAVNAFLVSTASTVASFGFTGNVNNSAQSISSSGGLTPTSQSVIGNLAQALVSPAYGATIAIDTDQASSFNITATNNTAFTISNPLSSITGNEIKIKVRNTSGGALGVVTFAANYKLGAAWVSPATGFSRSISFVFDGTNWVEEFRSAADVSN